MEPSVIVYLALVAEDICDQMENIITRKYTLLPV